MMLRRRLLTVALTALLALTGVACGGDDDGDDAVQAVAAVSVS